MVQVNKDTVMINGRQLKQVADTNQTAHEIIKALASRERFRRFTDIGRTKFLMTSNGITVDEKDFLNFYRILETNGYGKIIPGKNGKRDRFEWYYNLKAIGKAALHGSNEEADLVESISTEKSKSFTRTRLKPVTIETPANAIKVEKSTTALVYIPLRNDFNVDFTLPADLTPAEIATIKSALDRFSK